MKIRSFVVTGLIAGALSVATEAQQVDRRVTQQPPGQQAPPVRQPQGVPEADRQVVRGPGPQIPPPQLTNIRFEVMLTETGPTPMKRTMTMVVADGSQGRLRTAGQPVPNSNIIPQLNVDIRPRIERNGLIRASFVIEYKTRNSLSFEPLLESGKSMVVFEAPELSDSTTTVTVTATIMK
jgi:hypothetical protein